MISISTPSTSFDQDELIGGGELDHLMRTEPHSTCILDCRPTGSAIRSAYRVRLPSVLFRRLVNCSLSLSTLSPLLNDAANVKVVIVPEQNGFGDFTISNAVTNALRKANISYRIIKDPIETVLSSFPSLHVDDDHRPSCRSTGGDVVGCLNLNALRIEPAIGPSTEKRQHFPVQILPHLFLGNYETASDAQLWSEAIAFIDTAAHTGDACLVHCLAGISRSVTVCLAYLMAKNKWSLEDAYDLVLRRNASIAPNFHFMGQLIEYERHLGVRGTIGGIYPSVPPLSPSCSIQAGAVTSGLLTPPPTSCSTSPQSSAHSANSFV